MHHYRKRKLCWKFSWKLWEKTKRKSHSTAKLQKREGYSFVYTIFAIYKHYYFQHRKIDLQKPFSYGFEIYWFFPQMKILTPWKERKNISKVKIPPMRKHVDCREFAFNFSILCSKNIFPPIEVSHLQQRFFDRVIHFYIAWPRHQCLILEINFTKNIREIMENSQKKFYFSVKSISRKFSYLYSFSIQYLIEEIEYCADTWHWQWLT